MRGQNGFEKPDGSIEEPSEAGVQIWPQGSEGSEGSGSVLELVLSEGAGREL